MRCACFQIFLAVLARKYDWTVDLNEPVKTFPLPYPAWGLPMSFTQLPGDSLAKSQRGGAPVQAQACDTSPAATHKPSVAENSRFIPPKCGDLQHDAGQAAISIEATVPLTDSDYTQPLLVSRGPQFNEI